MANLSNTSPLGSAFAGMSQGVKEAGAINTMLTESRLAPMREKLLQGQVENLPLQRQAMEQQNAMGDIGLKKAQEEERILNQPWDHMNDPLFKALPSDMQKSFAPQADQQFTNRDRASMIGQILSTKQGLDVAESLTKTKLAGIIAEKSAALGKAIEANSLKPGSVDLMKLSKMKDDLQQDILNFEAVGGKIEAAQTSLAIKRALVDPGVQDIFVQYPSVKVLFDIASSSNDLKAVNSVLDAIVKLKTNPPKLDKLQMYVNAQMKLATAAERANPAKLTVDILTKFENMEKYNPQTATAQKQTKAHQDEMAQQGREKLSREKQSPEAVRFNEYNKDQVKRGLPPITLDAFKRFESALMGQFGRYGIPSPPGNALDTNPGKYEYEQFVTKPGKK